jgi:serine/threonine-protein kinase ULK/ATG1
MAPEVKEGKYDGKCDLWSLGIVIYILIKKRNPSDEIIDKISSLELIANTELNNLIQRLLVKDPDKRISWDEYFDHPFFINNKIIIKLKVTEKDKIQNEFKDI